MPAAPFSCSIVQYKADGVTLQNSVFTFGSQQGALALSSAGAAQVLPMGSAAAKDSGNSAGQIPVVPIPLGCMDLTMTLPMRATGNVVSVDLASASNAGVMAAAQYSKLDGLATVASTGAYGDLSGRPTLGTASAQNTSFFATAAQGTLAGSALQPGASIPWNTVTGAPTSLSGYGIIDGVSSSGSYANPSWITSFAYSKLTGAPSLATVATTGAYSDLTGKPTIPAAQVNSDWNASSGLAQILNKPTLGTAASQNTTFFASAAQGTEADTACQSGAGALSVTATVMSIAASSASVPGTMSSADFSKLAAFPAYAARSFTNNVTLTIQTVAAAGNGSQVSTTRDSVVSYSASVTTTSTIGGPQSGTIVLEVCATNSSTAANWQEISRITNSQTITLAIALQSVQVTASALAGMIPAGFFRRLRSVATSGSPSFTYNSGQEVLL